MNTTTRQTIVDEAVTLVRQIKKDSDRLKALKLDLIEEAKSSPWECIATEGGGKSWTAEGKDGSVARVTFPADSLSSEIKEGEPIMEKIRKLTGKVFDRLFRPSVSYRPVAEFRAEAVTLLGEIAGNQLIDLCESETSPRLSFETVRREVEV